MSQELKRMIKNQGKSYFHSFSHSFTTIFFKKIGRVEDPSFSMLFAVVAIGGLIYGYNMVGEER